MPIIYAVYDNDKPASYPYCKVHKSWDNHLFVSFDEAEDYALKWLGAFGPTKGVLKIGQPYNYSGYGDVLIIAKLS